MRKTWRSGSSYRHEKSGWDTEGRKKAGGAAISLRKGKHVVELGEGLMTRKFSQSGGPPGPPKKNGREGQGSPAFKNSRYRKKRKEVSLSRAGNYPRRKPKWCEGGEKM